jgi:tetratricopeptide (TPR) repeat protein
MNKDTKSELPVNAADNTRPGPMPCRRLWLFRIIAVVIAPALVLALLELILRVAGFGYPTGAFVRSEVNGRPVYCSNSKFGWRFFPPEFARELSPLVVPADKADNTYRIFVLGESAANGDPDPSYCFGRMLRVMLRKEYPSVNFEVSTVAMAAINSHAIVQIAKDCAPLKPDLFVVYMGNNEVTGPYGAGTVFSPLSKSLFLIRTGIAIKATRLGQLMIRLVGVMSDGVERPKIYGGLDVFLGKQIRRDDEQMRFVYSHFQRNLEDIVRIAQKAGARTIVSTIAVNLKDCPPFASLHRPNLDEQQRKQFDSIYQNGIKLEKAGDFKDAIENYLAAARIDDSYAELQFRLGRCQWNLGQFEEARGSYTCAKELDTLRFRADSGINGIIRRFGAGKADQGIYFVDAADVFEQKSPHNLPGFEFFYEHVHFNFSGNYLLARTVFDRVEEILPPAVLLRKSEAAGGPPSEDECAELATFTNYDNYRVTQKCLTIISGEPFVNQAYHDEIMDVWRQKAERLKDGIGPDAINKALEQYEQAIKRDSTDRLLRLNYARLLLVGKKDTHAAAEQYRLITEQIPDDHQVLTSLASTEMSPGNIDSALKHATRAVEIMPTDPVGNYVAGLGYQMKGQQKKAQRYFAEAIRFGPDFVQAYIDLCKIFIQQGNYEQARRVYRKGIEAVPDNPTLHVELASLLRRQGLWQEADIEQQKAIAMDPNIAEAMSRRKLDGKP